MGKNILLITTGGTIGQTKSDDNIAQNDADKKGRLFLQKIDEKRKEYDLDNIFSKDPIHIDSSNITPKHWKQLIDIICEKYEEVDAFIITHGTNTLGYTCAALSFALGAISKPVILTGSQVPFGDFGSDAEMNLENCFRVASQSKYRIKGVVAVFGSRIITGTRVKKISEFAYDAFKTFSVSDLGHIGRVIRFNRRALEKHNEKYGTATTKKELDVISPDFKMENIISLTEFPGLNEKFIKRLVDGGKEGEENVEGIILRSTGAGDPNIVDKDVDFKHLSDCFRYLQEKKIPVIVTTQAPDGVASMAVNDPGKLAKELGAVPAWDMSIEAMTTKLAWLLAQNLSYNMIRARMEEDLRGEIDRHADIEESVVK